MVPPSLVSMHAMRSPSWLYIFTIVSGWGGIISPYIQPEGWKFFGQSCPVAVGVLVGVAVAVAVGVAVAKQISNKIIIIFFIFSSSSPVH